MDNQKAIETGESYAANFAAFNTPRCGDEVSGEIMIPEHSECFPEPDEDYMDIEYDMSDVARWFGH